MHTHSRVNRAASVPRPAAAAQAPATPARQLSTAEERRAEVLPVAARAFAERGLHGTPTAEIARDAGISQAYLFRLFPTKLELFVAVVDRCFSLTLARFQDAATTALREGVDVLCAIGEAYVALMADRHLLLGQLQAHAAAATEPLVRDAVRRGFAELFAYARRVSGAGDEEIRQWFAAGMLINVLAAIDAQDVDEPWARALVADHSAVGSPEPQPAGLGAPARS